ncbi:MAG: hypothetical protein MJ234_02730 [bacterium]|nr:hypothetical protein [bacterium]
MDYRDFFNKDGILSENIPSYEYRAQQAEMADSVASALENGSSALIEAGTGTGKSLAYLIPAAIYCAENIKRCVISTYSKTLQQQLMEKDLPFIRDRLAIGVRFAMAMGSKNYLCRRRFDNYIKFDRFQTKTEAKTASRIQKWAAESESCSKNELSFEVPASTWDKISREPDLCLRGKCPFFSECGFARERSRLNSAHIIVVNHHLFFADIAAGGTIIPKYDAVVFDEAQNVEEAAMSYFGIRATNGKIKHLADSILSSKTGKGFIARAKHLPEDTVFLLQSQLEELRSKSEAFFRNASGIFAGKKLPFRIKEKEWILNTISPELRKTAAMMKEIKDSMADPAEASEAAAYVQRAKDLAADISSAVKLLEDDFVYWIENEKGKNTAICASPVDVSPFLSDTVFNGSIPIILTSATIASENKFDFIKKNLGISSAEEKILDSPFDYRKNALMYMPSDLPEPSSNPADFEEAASVRIGELAEISGGGCMALFTNYRHMEATRGYLEETMEGFTILVQGDKPQFKLIEEFRKTEKCILLGTSSFWQGVDIPGNALKMVIIVKLPFAAPDDPVIEARCEKIEDEGGNAFMDLSVPSAIIWLKQGFGRLIRTANDKGVAAILDKRVMTKYYGRKFVKSLPQMLYTTRINDVRIFLEKEIQK